MSVGQKEKGVPGTMETEGLKEILKFLLSFPEVPEKHLWQYLVNSDPVGKEGNSLSSERNMLLKHSCGFCTENARLAPEQSYEKTQVSTIFLHFFAYWEIYQIRGS